MRERRIDAAIKDAFGSGERENDILLIEATVPGRSDEVVARFHVTLSLKEQS